MVKRRHPFRIEGWVVLPDPMHRIWTPPPGDPAFSTRRRLIRGEFSRRLPQDERRPGERLPHGERGVWQRRFREHRIREPGGATPPNLD